MASLIDTLLPVFRDVADKLEGSQLAANAQTDVAALEEIVTRRESALTAAAESAEKEAADWLAARLHPAPATAAQTSAAPAPQG